MERKTAILPIDDFGYYGVNAEALERALAQAPGVLHVYVNDATEMAYIQYDAECCMLDTLREAILRMRFLGGSQITP